jgi:hypothetical protein
VLVARTRLTSVVVLVAIPAVAALVYLLHAL